MRCVCMSVITHVSADVQTCTFICRCGGQRLKAIVFINLSLSYILKSRISYSHLELTNLSNLASQIFLSLPSKCQN